MLVYLKAAGHLGCMPAQVEGAGGKPVAPAASMGDFGTIARFDDAGGNRLAMHTLQRA